GLHHHDRGFIVPGTLWCGSGNKAPSYADLETDSCCREHDQCKHTILSFHSDFGVFNTNIFTMSHCDCDNRFHSCLKEANDSISHVVGYTFFNLLKMNFLLLLVILFVKNKLLLSCAKSQLVL
uniref:Phospholipase A2-like central domain-containing protein n=1 Tax=Echeneis naucrates TaxID=173247 RepID=A0A665UDF1_ECHNA